MGRRDGLCGAFVFAALALGFVLAGLPGEPVAGQNATGAAAAPLFMLATAEGRLADPDAELVWVVQRGAVYGENLAPRQPFPLGFALARRGTLAIRQASGATAVELAAGQAAPLPLGTEGSFASATGDLTLFAQIALVPVQELPSEPTPDYVVTTAFSIAAEGPITLELARGFVNPGAETLLPAPQAPVLLLALDNPIRVETAGAGAASLARDEFALLAADTAVHNDSPYLASFVTARITTMLAAATSRVATPAAAPIDRVVDEAWRRNGCHLNPGNAACMAVGVAAACAIDSSDAACAADGDGDGCSDVAEIRAAFDPYDPSDCISDGQGAPAVNCLFPTQDLPCGGAPDAAFHDGCAAAADTRIPSSTSLDGCALATPPPDPCVVAPRDPQCDGFAPGRESSIAG